MAEWQQYADQVVNRFDYDTNQWAITNCNTVCSIYGTDGSLWTDSAQGGANLTTYQFEVENDDGSKAMVDINEVDIAIQVADGNKKPTQVGIRMGGAKYMLQVYDADNKVAKCVGNNGGATVGKTNTAIIVAFWKKDQNTSEGKPQNGHESYKLVQEMCAYLAEQGY